MSLALWEFFWESSDWVTSTSTGAAAPVRRPLISLGVRVSDVFTVQM